MQGKRSPSKAYLVDTVMGGASAAEIATDVYSRLQWAGLVSNATALRSPQKGRQMNQTRQNSSKILLKRDSSLR